MTTEYSTTSGMGEPHEYIGEEGDKTTESPPISDKEGEAQGIPCTKEPEPDGLDFIDPVEINDGSGADCELHVYESRYDTRGENVVLRVGVKHEFEAPKDRSHAAALVLTRFYSEDKELYSTRLEVRSPYLRKALREVIKSYPGIDFDPANNVWIHEDDASCLFHYRAELEVYAESSGDEEMQRHLHMLLQYVKRRFHEEIKRYDATVAKRQASAGSEFKYLWMAYKPGDLLYQKSGEIDTLATLESLTFEEGELFDDEDEYRGISRWEMRVKRVQRNGTHLGYVYDKIILKKYEGFAAFSTLDIFPLHFHSESQQIKTRLLGRGKKYMSLADIHHCQYNGTAKLSQLINRPTTVKDELIRTRVRQRIMVDFEEFYQNAKGPQPDFQTPGDILGSTSSDIRLEDTDFLICHHEVTGYTLITKRWGFFDVELVHPVNFNEEAFQNLVLEEDKKQLISSLILSRNLEGFSSDDFIEGKGKGVIILLHGPPGVGKTFTAEAMADHARRPLLTANSGQFVGPPPYVESILSRLLHLAERWQALLLLDEADVFMQARNLSDLERNGLVSMLLRILEYFEGTLFLTTNRVGTIDSAFMSRIHLALSYSPLTKEAKQHLWDVWIARACGGERPAWAADKLLKALASFDVSGRDIKNIALLAQAVAKSGQRGMAADDIWKGVTAMTQFQEDFKKSVPDEGLGRNIDGKELTVNQTPSISWAAKAMNHWWYRS
ncbi:ATPase family AAA domain-containing protein 3B [Colletotrichum aenigma]|uniref:ATPase family AAA domain-containing protein 3B n=1 Tax=Colletotrichum aenigma TaxID=1215731 RepID=UPI001872FD98|nr:ATPase family AAA domain-containing protein 3B [Colletotrichum aenigma]KAF5502790.1 ATPase family AAA domain-containing protein 3B [Colletotrichum aenigma]